MNNCSDCSEDCFEDFYFFYDGDDEKDLNSALDSISGIPSMNKEKFPDKDSGGFFHEETNCVSHPQIEKSDIYEGPTNDPNCTSFQKVIPMPHPLKEVKQNECSYNFLADNSQMLQLININRFYGQNCHKRKRVELDESGASFRSAFYNICGKSIFPKEYVQQLHDAVCSSIGLPPISRTERRSIRTYFKNYAKHKTKIINAVKEYLNCKQDLVNKICTPCKLKNSTKKSC